MDAAVKSTALQSGLAGARAPLVVDVRKAPAFSAASDMIAGALRRDPVHVASWAPELPRASAVVAFSHDGDLCSFDAFLKNYHLTDPALEQLALIVRGADTAHPEFAPQSAGLLGLSRNFSDDHEILRRGMVMHDALYAWSKDGRNETHAWNPSAYC